MEKVVNWRGQPKMIPREGVVFFNAGHLNASFTKTFHFLRFPCKRKTNKKKGKKKERN